MLEFIIQNESIESVRASYEDKIKELRGRLKNREEGKEVGSDCTMQRRTWPAGAAVRAARAGRRRTTSRGRSARPS
jgi:hypothetical protein